MSKKVEQTLWVTAVNPELIDGQAYIPTTLFYDSKDISIGVSAAIKENVDCIANTNFKVDLGEVVPGGAPAKRRQFKCSDGKER
ncbi:MAG: hypothetical protein KDI30_00975, partial [Pseudomonadales bacterium]|nr:hypothetical protein [Pseudomonadales bacterium]